MRAAAIGVLVVACAPAAAPPISQHAEAKPHVTPTFLVTRHLAVGTSLTTANRYTSELTLDGTTATLVQTDEQAEGAFTLERADRYAHWTVTRTTIRKGPLTRTGDRFTINVEGDTDSMFLSCAPRKIEVAHARARRVAHVGHELDCDDPGTWSPAATTRVDAIVCGAEDAGDDDDLMTHWFFTEAPGIDSVEESDDCLHGEGLRLSSAAVPRR